MVADTTVNVDDMPDILDDYSWCSHQRNNGTVKDIHIPWPAVHDETQEMIERRAHLAYHIHQIITGYDADTVRTVLNDLADLVDVYERHDEFPAPPQPPAS